LAKVLVVDDEPDIRNLIQHLLSFAGHEVQLASDGAEALMRIGQERPDAMILDVSMPVMDGFQVLEYMRADPETAEIPVVLVTSLPPVKGENAGRKMGVTHYLTKPWEAGTLETAVRVLLRETQKRQALDQN
jgi:DNA-binding response OmpR family regulator